jgi:hypothetical protein
MGGVCTKLDIRFPEVTTHEALSKIQGGMGADADAIGSRRKSLKMSIMEGYDETKAKKEYFERRASMVLPKPTYESPVEPYQARSKSLTEGLGIERGGGAA